MMKPDEKPPLNLSVCSILKDEAANLPGLIGCLPLSRLEWIVVDTGSRDATLDLIRKAGIEPHFFTWTDNFAEARNASLALAKRDWILWLDGDDRVDEDFWQSLEPLLYGPKQAYRFIVRSPREKSHGDRFLQIRLFPNHVGIRFEGPGCGSISEVKVIVGMGLSCVDQANHTECHFQIGIFLGGSFEHSVHQGVVPPICRGEGRNSQLSEIPSAHFGAGP